MLPVAALELEAEATQGLLRAGLKTIGDMAARPMAAIAARFGGEAVPGARVICLAKQGGRSRRALACTNPRRAPLRRAGRTDRICAAGAGRAGGRSGAPARAGPGWRAAVRGGLLPQRRAGSAAGGRDQPADAAIPALVIRLFDERIEGLIDPIDPGFGFDLIRLSVPVVEPLAAAQLRLEGGAARDAEVAALIDRLSTRLGRNRVRRLVPVNTHIPEQMQLALPAVEAGVPAASWPRSASGEPPLRPLHLFDPPQPIEVIAEVPDGPPHRFRWRRKFHEVSRFEGPGADR